MFRCARLFFLERSVVSKRGLLCLFQQPESCSASLECPRTRGYVQIQVKTEVAGCKYSALLIESSEIFYISAIPYMEAGNLTHCKMLRNSKTSSLESLNLNPTLIEAIRISWATPGLFSPVRVGIELVHELTSAVLGYNNPTLKAIEEAYEVFGPNRRVSCILSLGTGPVSTPAVSKDGDVPIQKIAEDTETTAEHLKRRYASLQVYFRLSVNRNLDCESPSKAIEYQAGTVTARTSDYLETYDVCETLERCLISSQKASHTTMEHLCK